MKKTKLLSLILAMLMLTSSVFAAPVALPTVDSAQETEEAAQQHFPAAEAEVGAESLPKLKPGINILTGTKEALNFNGEEFKNGGSISNNVFRDDNGNDVLNFDTNYLKKVAVVDSPVAGEPDNKALKLSDYYKFLGSSPTGYPTIMFDNVNYKVPEGGRPVFVSFNSIVDNVDYLSNPEKAGSSGLRLQSMGLTKENVKNPYSAAYGVNYYYADGTPSAWTKITVEDRIYDRDKLARIVFYAKIDKECAKPSGKDYVLQDQKYAPNHYLDDIMYVPYYKVTYKNGNTEVGEKYVLFDENGNFLTEFDPYTQGVALPANKNGWALAPNGEPVTSVELNNEDIVLYAVTQYMDKTVAFFDFSSQDNIKEWDFPKFKNDKGDLKAADVVTSSDKTNPLVGAENAVKATVWLEKKADETLSYDAQIQLAGKMEIPPASINVIEIRVKAEKVTEMVNKNNKTETIPATLDDSPAQLFLHIKGLDQYYQTTMKWSEATKDENGWYTFTFETDALKPSDNKNPTTWDTVVANNNNNVNILRFDPSNTDGTFYIDYIKLYGKTNDITPIAPYAPKNIGGVSFRVDPDNAKTGVRFKASMLNTTRDNTRMTEYGWIVALEETLGVQELTHEFDAKARVEGKAFIRNGIDKIFDTNENSTIFSAVVTGIPVEFADKVLAIRPYSFMNGGYIYGKTVLISPREVAQGVKDNNSDFYEKNKDYIDSLLGKSQEVAE